MAPPQQAVLDLGNCTLMRKRSPERELRAMFTSAVLPDGTALGTVITAQAKRLFSEK